MSKAGNLLKGSALAPPLVEATSPDSPALSRSDTDRSNSDHALRQLEDVAPIAERRPTQDPPIVDVSTGLPSLTALSSGLRPMSEHGASIYYIHLPSNPIIEERFGWEVLETYLGVVYSFLGGLATEIRRECNHCQIARAFADDYILMTPYREDAETLVLQLTDGLARHMRAVDEELASIHKIYIGLATVKPRLKIHPERLLFRGIQRAQMEATDVGRQQLSGQIRLLDRCITGTRFSMVYQPLVAVTTNEIFAYEALARCGQGELRSPHVLFNVAEQGGRIWQLSRVLRRMAMSAADKLPPNVQLFINLHPQDMNDPNLLAPEPFLTRYADRVVLEITERAAINDFVEFRRNVDILRKSGLRFAVDDLGSGYTALNSAAELHPEYIKLDMTLIRDIDKSQIRQNLVKKMISFAIDAGAEVVGEGVETQEELDTLADLGCHYVQGFFLASPAPAFSSKVNSRARGRNKP